MPFEWQKTVNEEREYTYKASKGLRMMIMAIYSSNCRRLKETLKMQEEYTKEQYKRLDTIREKTVDPERLQTS